MHDFRAAAGIAMLLLVPAAASAQQTDDLDDLVGARAAGAETQMQARGYRATGGNTVGDRKFTFWWNDRKSRCVSVSTSDGRYASIQPVPAGNCDQAGSTPAYGADRPAPTDVNSLVLVCYGGGTRLTVSPSQYEWNPWSQKWEWGATRTATEGFESDVQIELYGDHGRVHLGKSLVPPINAGGSGGWWDLDNLNVTPEQITASYRLNGLNKPHLSVDRRSGRIEIKGLTNFAGHCDIGDWAKGQHRF